MKRFIKRVYQIFTLDLNIMGEIIKLSRSTDEKYLSCPRCCVLDKKFKIKPHHYHLP